MAEPLPHIQNVRDIPGLFRFLEHAEAALKDKWLADAREAVKANQEAVRLLGATDKIERDLKVAETAKTKAEQSLVYAKAASRSIVAEAEDGIAARETEIAARETAFAERTKTETADLARKRDELEETVRDKLGKIIDREKRADDIAGELHRRERSVEGCERRVTTREEEAKAAKAEAEALTERMGAAMVKPAQPAA